ncbi:MAG: creatininase family protein [Clostridia bacterium]|nr:creatininase family protein [Clostridia bacterium]
MAYYMEQMTVRDMEEAIKKTKTVIIPTGVVEQHGYHLPLSTDIFNATKPLEIAGERLNAVVAPSVNYCFSGGELLGTVNVSPNTFGLYISEICSEFIRMGFENIIVFLGHAGTDNLNALKNSLQMLLRRSPDMHEKATISLMEAWNLSPTWLSGFSMEPEHDFHAGMMETGLMMYWKSELVRDEIVMDDEYVSRMMRTDQDWFEKREKHIDSPFMVEKVGQREEIKVGVMGLPHKATREIGEKICSEIIDNLVDYVNLLEKNRRR